MNDDELKSRIADLESQPFFTTLNKLQPHAEGRDLYALGFAAGERAQAARVERSRTFDSLSRWSCAAISSAASVAATVAVMLQLAPVIERSSSQHMAGGRQTAVAQPTPPTLPIESPQTADVQAAFDFEDTLAELNRRAHRDNEPSKVALDDVKPTIARDSLRYVSQRKEWIADLSANAQ